MSPPVFETQLFDAHGFRFTVACPDPATVATFDDLLVDMIATEPPSGQRLGHRFEVHATAEPELNPTTGGPWMRVTLDGEDVYPTLAEGSLVSHVLIAVNSRAVDACRDAGGVPLHAGTVAGAHGALLLPGVSHSGKTTVATALAAHGRQLLADEVSCVDPTNLEVARYGKPVALRAESVEVLAPFIHRLGMPASRFETDERFVAPSEIGPSPAPGSQLAEREFHRMKVTSIVFPRFDATEQTRLTTLSPGATLERLMTTMLAAQPDDRPLTRAAFRTLERLVRSAPGHELVYADLDVALSELGAIAI